MKRLIGTFAIFLSACGGGSSTDTNVAPQLIEQPDLSAYEDYAVQMSADGQRAAFLSRRDAGSLDAYIHEQGAAANPRRLSDVVPAGANEEDRQLVLAADGQWLLLERKSTEAHYLLLSRWDGQATLKLPVGQNTTVSDLALSSAAKLTIGFTERVAGVQTTQVFDITVNANQLTSAVTGSFTGEGQPLFSELPGGILLLMTATPTVNGASWKGRTFGTSTNTWIDKGTPLTVTGQEIKRSASARGLFYAQSLSSLRTKTKLGSNTDRPTGYVPVVGVLDSLFQFDPSAGSAVDFAASTYRAFEPLSISSVSASADGNYLLLTGSETYFCKTAAPNFNSMLLVRTSDMSVIPLFVSRPTGQAAWSELMSDPCSYFDQASPAVPKDFDNALIDAEIAGTDGSTFRIVYESVYTRDREVYRLEFKVDDWSTKTLSGTTLVNLSNNPRP